MNKIEILKSCINVLNGINIPVAFTRQIGFPIMDVAEALNVLLEEESKETEQEDKENEMPSSEEEIIKEVEEAE